MGASDLSTSLWQERRELELLLFKLETQRLHVQAGNLKWLHFVASEIEGVLDRQRFDALARSVESAAVATEWGLPAHATLAELIAGAPAGPWAEILREHLVTLRDLLRQLSEAAQDGERLLRTLREPGRPGASPDGAAVTATGADSAEALYQLSLTANIERALALTQRATRPLLAPYLDGGPA
jgi:hypothetical protein